ncbi:MAG: response regulator [Erysipelotrichia bacterium]|nr:response regulator [Candidatus Riflebacteria bacterium]NCB37351.1 response regulator [Erysipelotrichia bacterium]
MAKTILVAEDSLMLRKVACFPLEKQGYKVLEANNGIEAIEAMSKNEVDIIITDLNMPGMDGFELISQVKENEKFKHIPIIILTTEGKKDMVMKGLTLGANAFLQKPIKPDVMLKEVERLLSKSTGKGV